MADKLSPLILDALTRAAVEPAGMPLFATKSESGLFPNTAVGKAAARKAQDDHYLHVSTGEPHSATITEKGIDYLISEASPKEILEDFLRLLEDRRNEISNIQNTMSRFLGTLESMRGMISQVMPQVVAERTNLPKLMLTKRNVPVLVAHRNGALNSNVAVIDGPTPAENLAETIYTRLEQWSANAGIARDYPLADLYESLSFQGVPSVGTFHDALRELHADGRIYLHPWTGPLYSLPEPRMALLVGHEVAYYASIVK